MNNQGFIVNGNIDSNLAVAFQKTMEVLVRKKQSYLAGSPAVKSPTNFANARILYVPRAGATTFESSNERNAQYERKDYLFDSRVQKKERWVNATIMDNRDIRDAIVDPRSPLYEAIADAINDLKDRAIINACFADVEKADPITKNKVILTRAEDGVRTIDATSGYNYDTLKLIKRNFANQYVKNITIVQTANEEAELLNDIRTINNYFYHKDATASQFDNNGAMIKTLGMSFISNFAGSDNGTNGIGKINNYFLPEIAGERYCLALGEGAVQFATMKIETRVRPYIDGFVDSSEIITTVEATAMRLQGPKVLVFKTTI